MSGRDTAAVACSGQNSARLASSPTSSQVLGSISSCLVFVFFLSAPFGDRDFEAFFSWPILDLPEKPFVGLSVKSSLASSGDGRKRRLRGFKDQSQVRVVI